MSHKGWLLWFVAGALLTAATWSLGLGADQYDRVASLAFGDDFPGDGELWLQHGEPDNIDVDAIAVRLEPRVAEQSYAKRLVTLPPRDADDDAPRLLRTRALVEILAAPTPLDDPKDDARVMLFLLDDEAGEEPVSYRTVLRASGAIGERRDDLIVELADEIDAFFLVFMNRFSDGRFALLDADVELVDVNGNYRVALLALVALWIVLGLVTFGFLLRRGGLLATGAIALPIAAILIGVSLPESTGLDSLRHAFDRAGELFTPLAAVPFEALYKVGHLLFFLLLALLAVLFRRRLGLSTAIVCASLVLLAIATEGLQLHLFDRTGRWSDLLIDTAGIGAGAALGLALLGLRDRFARSRTIPTTTPDGVINQ